MVIAEQGRGASDSEPAEGHDPEVEALASAYVEAATGDVRLALRLASRDAIEATRLVSRGFARWGRIPARQRW